LSSKKRGLGRGLDALLNIESGELPAESLGEDMKPIAVDLIQRGEYQPRLNMAPEALEELASSIRTQGILQPIVVRPIGNSGRYELLAGERRWRAAQLAGLREIPSIIKMVANADAMSIALIENIQREQLNPVEEATAFSRLANEFSMTHREIADSVGRSRAAVTNLLRLLELEKGTRKLLEAGDINMGHARALLAISGPSQLEIAKTIVEKGLSVRDTEGLVRRTRNSQPTQARASAKSADPNVLKLERDLSDIIGGKVTIRASRDGRGKVTIYFSSLDELDGILERFNK
jgi:ParB family chromosome partitioning protein